MARAQLLLWVAVTMSLAWQSVRCQRDDQLPTYQESELEIYQMHIRSDVTFRFVTTLVSVKLTNRAQEDRELEFEVTLPSESAFISNFSMTIDDKLYYGIVKRKHVAREEYEEAQDRGESAALIRQISMPRNLYGVVVNVAAQSKVDFNLTYQELLVRRLGIYELLINVDAGQVVRDLKVDVNIRESRPITALRVPPMRNIVNTYQSTLPGDNQLAVVNEISPNEVHISYHPSVREQILNSENGVRGQFIVQYDVERSHDGGELQLLGGYFVQYFAPSGLDPIPKDICLILDVSGSMSGDKLLQMKDSTLTLLDDLRPDDVYSLVVFSGEAQTKGPLRASPSNIAESKRYVRSLNARGGTNVNEALLRGISLMTPDFELVVPRPIIIVLLTDGNPTTGTTSFPIIAENVRSANQGRAALFCLGFGGDVAFDFLKKLSLQNGGFARKIFLGAEATLQLEGFYEEISNPLLSSVRVTYVEETVDVGSLTGVEFGPLFEGSEVVIAGKLAEGATSLPVQIRCGTGDGELVFEVDAEVSEGERLANVLHLEAFTERLWAYMTIQKLLDRMIATEIDTERTRFEQQAVDLSIKYGFVTSLTSMVVTIDNQNVTTDADDQSRGAMNDFANREQVAFFDHNAVGGGVHKSGLLPAGDKVEISATDGRGHRSGSDMTATSNILLVGLAFVLHLVIFLGSQAVGQIV